MSLISKTRSWKEAWRREWLGDISWVRLPTPYTMMAVGLGCLVSELRASPEMGSCVSTPPQHVVETTAYTEIKFASEGVCPTDLAARLSVSKINCRRNARFASRRAAY